MLLPGIFSHILDHPPKHRFEAQIYLATICRVDADTEITEQVPVFCYLICVTSQAGKTMDMLATLPLPLFRFPRPSY